VGSVAGLAIYRRFGFIYAAVGSLAACAAIPFQLDFGIAGKRIAAALVFTIALSVVRRQRKESEQPAGSGLPAIEAAAWLGTYLMLNIQLPSFLLAVPKIATWFFILSWTMIWLLPAAGLWLGVAKKDRLLIHVSITMTLLTFITNKRYLGWAVHPWDPMILGIVLMTAAIVIRRWLQSGPHGERSGFTALRLLRSDERKLAAVSIASSVMQPHISSVKHADAPHNLHEGGGSSGGGGASGNF
jgi:hypothetical protein